MKIFAWRRYIIYIIYIYNKYITKSLLIPQEQLKDFLDKQEKGELLVQKTHNLLKTILRKVSLAAYNRTANN